MSSLKKSALILIIVSSILALSYFYAIPTVETEIICIGHSTSSNENYISIYLRYNESSRTSPGSVNYIMVRDMPIHANLTDADGMMREYNLTTNAKGNARISSLDEGNYNISVVFEGNNRFKPSEWNGTVEWRDTSSYRHKWYDFS